MPKGFSIVVCCYNSADQLPETFTRLSRLKRPPGCPVELILIDNCSTDHTASLAGDLWRMLGTPFPLTILYETQPGLSYARMRGIAGSRYEFVLFCDDDNWLASDYLLEALPVLEKDPGVGMLGGLGTPYYTQLPSYWPADFFIYGSGPQASASGSVSTLHGAGMILRRQTIEKLWRAGFRFLLSDRKGEQLASGGDYELCLAVRMAGYRLWYSESLRFSHFIGPERLTRAYSRRFIRESAPAVNVLDIYYHVLAGGRHLRIRFWAKQFKLIAHHSRMALKAFQIRYRYRDHEKIVFLETFHLGYHLRRLRCIPHNLSSFGRTMRRICAISARLETGVPEPVSPRRRAQDHAGQDFELHT